MVAVGGRREREVAVALGNSAAARALKSTGKASLRRPAFVSKKG